MKTTMMWKTSIVPIILLLLAAVTNAAAAKEWKHKYIVTPRPMDANDAKHSNAHRYAFAKIKHRETAIRAEGYHKDTEAAKDKRDKFAKECTNGKDASTTDVIKDSQQEVTDATDELQKTIDALELAKKVTYAEGKNEDESEEAWKKRNQEENLAPLEETKKVQEKTLADAKKVVEKWEGFKKAYEADNGWPKDEKNAKWESKDADDIKNLKGWAKKRYDLEKAVTTAEEQEVKVTTQSERYVEMENGKPKQKDGKDVLAEPEAGSRDYWAEEMKKVDDHGKDLDTFLAQAKKPAGKVLGFFGDFHGTELLIGSDLELDDMKKVFTYDIEATNGHDKVEGKVFAEVREAKKDDVPAVTQKSYLRLNKGLQNQEHHGGMIENMVAYVEVVKARRDEYILDGDNKPILHKKPVSADKPDGKKETKTEQVLKTYLNLQLLTAKIYTDPTKPFDQRFEEVELDRESNDVFDILGDITDLSKATVADPKTGSTPSGTTTATKEGTNAWMIIGIICLVVIFLGGAVIAYRAYTASGSLQNTDI